MLVLPVAQGRAVGYLLPLSFSGAVLGRNLIGACSVWMGGSWQAEVMSDCPYRGIRGKGCLSSSNWRSVCQELLFSWEDTEVGLNQQCLCLAAGWRLYWQRFRAHVWPWSWHSGGGGGRYRQLLWDQVSMWRATDSWALLFVSLVLFIMLSGRCPRRAIGGYKMAYWKFLSESEHFVII